MEVLMEGYGRSIPPSHDLLDSERSQEYYEFKIFFCINIFMGSRNAPTLTLTPQKNVDLGP